MSLENIFNKGKKFVKRNLIFPLIATSFLFGCEKEIDNSEKENTPIKGLYENVRIVEEDGLNNIKNFDGEKFIFYDALEGNFSEGDIMVGAISKNTPNGFLREIER